MIDQQLDRDKNFGVDADVDRNHDQLWVDVIKGKRLPTHGLA